MTREEVFRPGETTDLRDVGGRTGESQIELARRAGVGRATISSVERAEHPTSVLVPNRLGTALGIPVGELLAPVDGPP